MTNCSNCNRDVHPDDPGPHTFCDYDCWKGFQNARLGLRHLELVAKLKALLGVDIVPKTEEKPLFIRPLEGL